MATERDIEVECQRLLDAANAENPHAALKSAVYLVTTLLTDVNRIATALESIAMNTQNRS